MVSLCLTKITCRYFINIVNELSKEKNILGKSSAKDAQDTHNTMRVKMLELSALEMIN